MSIEFKVCCELTLLEPASDFGVAQIDQRLFEHTAARKRLENIDALRTEKYVPVLLATHIAICICILGQDEIGRTLIFIRRSYSKTTQDPHHEGAHV